MKCLVCPNQIPAVKKKSTKYCSQPCYYTAKKRRANQTYHLLKSNLNERKTQLAILEKLFWVTDTFGKKLSYSEVVKSGFTYGISDGSTEIDGVLCYSLGGFRYAMNSEPKYLEIWKK